jgi:hypothetical protein
MESYYEKSNRIVVSIFGGLGPLDRELCINV